MPKIIQNRKSGNMCHNKLNENANMEAVVPTWDIVQFEHNFIHENKKNMLIKIEKVLYVLKACPLVILHFSLHHTSLFDLNKV